MDKADIEQAFRASRYDWADDRALHLGHALRAGPCPDKRSQSRAHYNDRDKFLLIVKPVVQEPLESEWH